MALFVVVDQTENIGRRLFLQFDQGTTLQFRQIFVSFIF